MAPKWTKSEVGFPVSLALDHSHGMLTVDCLSAGKVIYGQNLPSAQNHLRGSIVVSISACHAEDPGSIPGRGVS